MHMERRKVMALGKASLVVSLPRDWIKMTGIEKGDAVALTIGRDRSLTLRRQEEKAPPQLTITLNVGVNETPGSITRKVISCYLNGYDAVHLRSGEVFTADQQAAIRAVVKSLYMRIIEASASTATVQALINESMASVPDAVERMHIITSSMCSNVVNALRSWDPNLARSVLPLEEDIDQFRYFIIRLLRGAASDPLLAISLQVDMVDCIDYLTIANRVEHIADKAVSVAEGVAALIEEDIMLPIEMRDACLGLAEVAYGGYNGAMDAFMRRDQEASNAIIEGEAKAMQLSERLSTLIAEAEGVDPRLTLVRDGFAQIVEYSSDIAETTLDRAYKVA
jgi:phosphate uptake regulator